MIKRFRKLVPQKVVNFGKHLPVATIANLKYAFPSKKIKIIGVTGTDGKTTTTNMIYRVLRAAGKKVSMVSTINAEVGEKTYSTGFHVTSPDSLTIQNFIDLAVKNGDEYMVLEVTSHGLDQFRFWGINFEIGVITNVTHEHLDYHKTFENYLKTKAKLIKNVKVAVLNYDQKENFDKLSKLTSGKVVSFGFSKEADFNLDNFKVELKIPGEFNKLNALAAAACCKSLGIDDEVIQNCFKKFEALTGRMEEIKNSRGIKIIVDFAHTPNGLENALKAVKDKVDGKVISLIGAEGFRDEGKRAMMGQISVENADFTIITAVDPRGLIDKINEQILEGAKKAGGVLGENVFIENDRKKAISLAIYDLAKKGDIVGIFGKGHETSMNLDGKKEIHWSDKEAVQEVLSKR